MAISYDGRFNTLKVNGQRQALKEYRRQFCHTKAYVDIGDGFGRHARPRQSS